MTAVAALAASGAGVAVSAVGGTASGGGDTVLCKSSFSKLVRARDGNCRKHEQQIEVAGAPGADGSSCTVLSAESLGVETITIACDDGTSESFEVPRLDPDPPADSTVLSATFGDPDVPQSIVPIIEVDDVDGDGVPSVGDVLRLFQYNFGCVPETLLATFETTIEEVLINNGGENVEIGFTSNGLPGFANIALNDGPTYVETIDVFVRVPPDASGTPQDVQRFYGSFPSGNAETSEYRNTTDGNSPPVETGRCMGPVVGVSGLPVVVTP